MSLMTSERDHCTWLSVVDSVDLVDCNLDNFGTFSCHACATGATGATCSERREQGTSIAAYITYASHFLNVFLAWSKSPVLVFSCCVQHWCLFMSCHVIDPNPTVLIVH